MEKGKSLAFFALHLLPYGNSDVPIMILLHWSYCIDTDAHEECYLCISTEVHGAKLHANVKVEWGLQTLMITKHPNFSIENR